MKREDISRALGEIDPAFVEEAADLPARDRGSAQRWWQAVLPLAACLMLVLTAAWFTHLGPGDGGTAKEDGALTGQPPAPSAEGAVEGGVTALPPPGMVGGTAPEAARAGEMVGRVTDWDPESREVTILPENGPALTAVIPAELDLTGLEAGDRLTLRWLGEPDQGRLEAEQIVDLVAEKGETP